MKLHHVSLALVAAAALASPAAARRPSPVRPQSPQNWVRNDDYPGPSILAREEGTTAFLLSVDATGRVTGCAVTGSSGFARLDQTTCRLMMERARFKPARDSAGNPVAATWESRFSWQLP
ncbi:MAG: TonB family protein [Alphaproteobacteria bacterium]|nr:TonB family protein [Alphaproteobacteria bacterium]MBV9370525.1 TonB family protein [Alphaproteobacteria bacterium]MBV9901426.1 TonB family protein [Alphaproteobacteria bacterium]